MKDGEYDVAQICLNGHPINDSMTTHPEDNKEFCDKCGSKTITICRNCKAQIQGRMEGYLGLSEYTAPAFCYNCGKAFPWTEAKIQAAHDLAQELEDISEDEKRMLSESIDDLVKDTPRTTLAATRFKKIVSKIGKPVGKTLRDLIVDIASETAKKMLLP